MQVLILLLIFIFGSAVGSFLNVAILRLPEGKALTGRSACANCHQTLGIFDLIPILSFLMLGGKCRYCGKKISFRYLIIELISGLLFVWAYAAVRPVQAADFLLLLKFWLVISVCVITFVVDLEDYIILSNVVLPLTAVLWLVNLALDAIAHHAVLSVPSLFLSSLLGSIAGALPILALWYASKWRRGEAGLWMGFGDVELMLFLGAAAGLRLVGLTLFAGIILGGVVSVLLLVSGKKTLKSKVPFGVFLTPAAIVVLFYGEKLLEWYLAFLGI